MLPNYSKEEHTFLSGTNMCRAYSVAGATPPLLLHLYDLKSEMKLRQKVKKK